MTYNSLWFQKVLDCLISCSNERYICHASIKFEDAWRSKKFRAKLGEFAQNWIEESNNIVARVGSDDSEVLFYANIKDCIKWRDVIRQTRIDFLKWCIEKKVEISL